MRSTPAFGMARTTDLSHLRERLPGPAHPVVLAWLRANPVVVRIARPRRSKLGDFSAARGGRPHRISVNGDLNPYAFLVTLVHEFAHFEVVTKLRQWRDPHGPAWKEVYHRLMRPFLSLSVFPSDVLEALHRHLLKAPASSCTDHRLIRVLRRYDATPGLMLEQIGERTIFRFNDRLFVKGPRMRKRYKCRCLNDRRTYFIDPTVEVETGEVNRNDATTRRKRDAA